VPPNALGFARREAGWNQVGPRRTGCRTVRRRPELAQCCRIFSELRLILHLYLPDGLDFTRDGWLPGVQSRALHHGECDRENHQNDRDHDQQLGKTLAIRR
jgi:hypothetical protein